MSRYFNPVLLVPGEGLEPPTFGLQNRCTTAVLTRPSRGHLPQRHRHDDRLHEIVSLPYGLQRIPGGGAAQLHPRASFRTAVDALRFPSPA
jgi:hypothetical protein